MVIECQMVLSHIYIKYKIQDLLAKHYPNNRASKFLDRFTYSDNTIDG